MNSRLLSIFILVFAIVASSLGGLSSTQGEIFNPNPRDRPGSFTTSISDLFPYFIGNVAATGDPNKVAYPTYMNRQMTCTLTAYLGQTCAVLQVQVEKQVRFGGLIATNVVIATRYASYLPATRTVFPTSAWVKPSNTPTL